jgi:RND family efflux transporter MFP subunit
MKRMKFILGTLVLLLTISCETQKNPETTAKGSDKGIRVEIITVKQAGVTQNLNYSGLITPTVEAQLCFQMPGTVNQIMVDEGDFVKKGQVLAVLDKSTIESSYKAAKATQLQAQDAYDRLAKVYEKGSLPEIKWEEIKTKLAQANSAEQIAKNNLNNCTLKASSDGVIGARNLEIGNSVMPGIPVIDLVTIKDVFVRISVPENEINKFKKNQTATVVIQAIGQKVYEAQVERIGVVANQISKTYQVKLRMSNPEFKIKPGMVCDVNLSIEKDKKVIEVPSQAVVKGERNKNYIFLIDGKSSKVKRKEVEIGEFANNNLQILSGINEGDILVVNGQHKLTENMEVDFYSK